jgi:hypothetical protein
MNYKDSGVVLNATDLQLDEANDLPVGFEVIVRPESIDLDANFAGSMLNVGNVGLAHSNEGAHSYSEMSAELWSLCATKGLTPLWYGRRGATSSGFNHKWTQSILQDSDIFGPMVKAIASTRYGGLKSIWVSANFSGKHPWHRDKYKQGVNHRCLLTLGSADKIMWFRNNETRAMFGIRVPHGAVVVLDRYGAGMDADIEHRITGGQDSWLIAWECVA